jgi:hypothetical protein
MIDSEPLQAPLAAQEVALVLDHVSIELLPDEMVVGLAVNVTVGAGLPPLPLTVTVWLAEPEPLAPVQVSAYVVVLVGETVAVPLVAFAPVQPPLAVQEVAFVLDHVSVELLPDAIVAGLADKVTAGATEFVNPRLAM